MTVPISSRRTLTLPEYATALAVDISKSALRWGLRRTVRQRNQVSSEYDTGNWQMALNERKWERHSDISTYLFDVGAEEILAKVQGNPVRTSKADYYRYKASELASVIGRYAPECDEVAEIGSGCGTNLFSLSRESRWRRLTGFDISDNGRTVSSSVAAHFGLTDRMAFHRLDVTDKADRGFSLLSGQYAFTHFCIEQVPYDVEQVVRNILAARPRRVVHMEPTTELLNPWRPGDLANWLYVKSMDYQTRLFTVLGLLEKQGLLKVVARERMGWAPTLHNDAFLVAWEPRT
jgi:hypothetical protein